MINIAGVEGGLAMQHSEQVGNNHTVPRQSKQGSGEDRHFRSISRPVTPLGVTSTARLGQSGFWSPRLKLLPETYRLQNDPLQQVTATSCKKQPQGNAPAPFLAP